MECMLMPLRFELFRRERNNKEADPPIPPPLSLPHSGGGVPAVGQALRAGRVGRALSAQVQVKSW